MAGLLSYRNQSIGFLCKSMDWFLYDNGLRHERVKLESLHLGNVSVLYITRLLEELWQCLDQGLVFYDFLWDTFDGLSFQLLVAKLSSYILQIEAVCLIYSYITNSPNVNHIGCRYCSKLSVGVSTRIQSCP